MLVFPPLALFVYMPEWTACIGEQYSFANPLLKGSSQWKIIADRSSLNIPQPPHSSKYLRKTDWERCSPWQVWRNPGQGDSDVLGTHIWSLTGFLSYWKKIVTALVSFSSLPLCKTLAFFPVCIQWCPGLLDLPGSLACNKKGPQLNSP